MPEGDTIFRSAATLRRALRGQELRAFRATRVAGPRPQVGTTIADVEPRGKHLLVHFDAGEDAPPLTLRTHLRMTGSWHLYRPRERWWKPRHRARVVIEVDGAVAVCFSAPVVELLETSRLSRHPELTALGPDLCRSDADIGEALRRIGAVDPTTEIAVALLDQRVASGVGNIYKSEVLHACRIDPAAPVGSIDTPTRRTLLETASRLLRANLSGYPRETVPGGLAVYGRGGEPCARCGDPIVTSRQGEDARITYRCPSCQDGRTRVGR